VNLNVAKGANTIGSYVAMTRVQHRRDLLIYRPFPQSIFSSGDCEGPSLLLEHLRGKPIDWVAIEEKYTPKNLCNLCGFVLYKTDFLPGQWARKDKLHFCQKCVSQRVAEGTPLRCNKCGFWKSKESFSQKYQHALALCTRVCANCIETRRCRECGEPKEEHDYTRSEWIRCGEANTKQGKCKTCMKRNRETKQCSNCKRDLPMPGNFSKKEFMKGKSKNRCL